MGEFWRKLKQRKMVQWMLAYVAFAFALLQGIDIVAQQFGWPEGLRRGMTLVLVIGFCVTLVLAWYHGERGAQRVGGIELLIIALLLATGGGVLWVYAPAPARRAVDVAQAHEVDRPQRDSENAIPGSEAGTAVFSSAIPEKSVAVLPFANGGAKDEQFFSDGLSEDLINALSQFEGLKVISRNSAFQFRNATDSSKSIGEKLGVAHLLEGSVQKQGGVVRITATLVNAADGIVMWSQRYDKPYQDLFALQDAITDAVADALKVKLLMVPGAVVQNDHPPSGNLVAYTAYQQGLAFRRLGTEASMRQAIAAFSEATRLDPRYAAAYAELSRTWTRLAGNLLNDGIEIAQAKVAARTAADMALALDSDLALAHLARAFILNAVTMDYRSAEAESRRALQLAPNNAEAQASLGSQLATLGQNRRAVELTRQALSADPRNADWYGWLSSYLAALGQLDDARVAINTAIDLQPGASAFHANLATLDILRSDHMSALAAAKRETDGGWYKIALALVSQIGTDHAAADAALEELIRDKADAAPYQIAEVYALRRDPGKMFEWLNRAWTTGDAGVGNLLSDPLVLRYQDDPRFAAFCKKVGLPTTTDAVAMK